MTTDRKASFTVGTLFVITFITSIAAVLLYNPIVDVTSFLSQPESSDRLRAGALLDLLLIVANIGTAVVLYPVLRRQFPTASVGYVTARIMECVFIALGLVSVLALATLRESSPEVLASTGELLVTIYNWTFVLGPGFVVGIGNGLLLGWMMYRSGLVPRGMAMFGLVGGPLIFLSGAAIVLGLIDKGSIAQGIATVPEFIWEASLGVYLMVKGFRHPVEAPREDRATGGTAVPAGAAA